jgi:antitoxin HicB
MISYRVHLTPDDNDTLLVTSPDFPELTSFGSTRAEALDHALGALEEAIAARMSDREEIPSPSGGKAQDPRVALPIQASLKVLLYQAMWNQRVRKADLARRMSIHKQEVDRILDLNHATNLAKIEHAFEVLGKRLDVGVKDADSKAA